jgi:alkylation response protein AidB-like acyl-CoA dehydrogenase
MERRRDPARLAEPERPRRRRAPFALTSRHDAPALAGGKTEDPVDLNYSPEEVAFRDEARAWIRQSLPTELRDKVLNFGELTKDDLLRWHKILAKKGWVAPFWPKEWGGTDWTVVQRYIFEEECGAAGTPPIVAFGVRMCAPVLLRFGTDTQKRRFLPRIYNGEDFWVQGYSEPGSGSDLASLKTRAVRDGDHYVVTGQKIWTTLGHYGDWIFCLVRTDTKTEKRQDGISFLLVDMKTPGITVRPIILMDQGHEVNEVFFDEVRVPAENLVHEEGKGWTVAKYLLGYERMGTGNIAVSKRELARVKEMAGPLLDDPRFRDRLTRVEVELMALEITNMRFLDQLRGGRAPGAEVSLLKIKGTEIQQALTELMMQTAGPFAQAFRPVNGETGFDRLTASLVPRYCNVRKATIYAGSNEIQRNIIAKATLGL